MPDAIGPCLIFAIYWSPLSFIRTLLELGAEWGIDSGTLIPGVFYGIDEMRVGGLRRLEIAPHLGYGARGVPGVIPPNALLVAEVSLLGHRPR